MKKILLVFLLLLCFVFISCDKSENSKNSNTNLENKTQETKTQTKTETQVETEIQKTETKVETEIEKTETRVETVIDETKTPTKIEYSIKYYVDGKLLKEKKYESGTSVDLLDISIEYENYEYWYDKDYNKIISPLVIDQELEVYAFPQIEELTVFSIQVLQGSSYFKLHPLCLGEALKIDAVIKPHTASSFPYEIVLNPYQKDILDILEVVDGCYIKVKEGKESEYLSNQNFTYRLALKVPGWDAPVYSYQNRLHSFSVICAEYYEKGVFKEFIGKPTLSNEEYSPETGKLVLHDGDKFGLLFYEYLGNKFIEANTDVLTIGPITYEIIEGRGFAIDNNGVVSTTLDSVTNFNIRISCEVSFEVYSFTEEKNITVTRPYAIELS